LALFLDDDDRINHAIAELRRLSLSPDSVLVQDKTLPAAELDGRVVVMSLSAGAYFDFNRIGTEIWSMLAEPCPIRWIFDSLSQNYRVDRETVAREVTPFLQTLLEQQLIRTMPPDAAQ
jgi:coenzyme PQQ synthesis protein D (PqqD)